MKITIKINNEKDLLNFVTINNTFRSQIDVYKGSHFVDGKSILGVISLGLYQEFNVEILSKDKIEISEFEKEMERFR